MSLRTVVITWGNAGLGYACAASSLASKGGQPWYVVLACRDRQRGSAAAKQLYQVAGTSDRVETMLLDLASLASIRGRIDGKGAYREDSTTSRFSV
jgi:NAD(P)-dependent dehydrogenase (short-subunit alcohol dehydrogenase family)